MNFKKIVLLLILGLSLFNITSCADSTSKKDYYTITYNPEGGNMKKLEQQFKDHDSAEMLIPNRPGYIFLGWYNARGVKINKIYANKDYVLYARWSKIPASDKNYNLINLEDELINNIEITEDGLKVNLISNIDQEITYYAVLSYGEQSDFLINSDNAFVWDINNAFVENLDSNYKNTISVRIYYQIEFPEDLNDYYSKVQTFNILDLVTKEFNSIEKDILSAYNYVYEIKFDLNITNYTVSTNSSYYSSKIDKDGEYIYVTITCNDGYTIYKDANVYVNNSLVTKNYEINESKTILSYTIKDPTWTNGW